MLKSFFLLIQVFNSILGEGLEIQLFGNDVIRC